MLRNKDIICISTIDWDFNWQGHQEIMSAFARNGNRVLFIENTGVRKPGIRDIPRLKKRLITWIKSAKGFREAENNLFVYSPVMLPFPYSRISRFINKFILLRPLRRWCRIMDFHKSVVWTFLPTGIALDIAQEFDCELLVYYCIADFNELTDNHKGLERAERNLIARADLIFAQGKQLEDKCRKLNNNVVVCPFGVNMKVFEDFRRRNYAAIPEDMVVIKKPIIGYVGGIHRHIDFNLIKYIAQGHPEWSIALVGPVQTDISVLLGLKNVFLLGQKDFRVLPEYLNLFDVCIIPYQIQDYTMTVFPTKLNEYNAMGKPVVSTNLPEVVKFNSQNGNIVLIGDTYGKFADAILKALGSSDKNLNEKRIAVAKKSDWSQRINEMSGFLEEIIRRKEHSSTDWREKFLRIYKTVRHRAVFISAVTLSVYLLLFHSPFIWFIASPLKVHQDPQKADSIVVFSGGVGESGKVDQGQSYQERLLYAVDLYNNGFAPRMIFSSGYTYHIQEPELMKAMAVSLGVPAKDILLEKNATSTYQNVVLTSSILKDKGWSSALLVSSPYHMLRTSLVFKKIAPGLRVYYVPIPHSSFYNRADGVRLRQIKAILHEYLAILYYKIRGYI